MTSFEELKDAKIQEILEDYIALEKKIDEIPISLSSNIDQLHDSIKIIPEALEQSLHKLSKKVEEAEKSSEQILENHKISSQAVSLSEIELLKTKISQTINNAVEKSIGEPLSESKEIINKLNNQLHNSTSPMPRSGWATIIILIFVSTFFGMFSLFSYLKNISLQQKNMELQQDINFENRRFAYHMEVINRLPKNTQAQYDEEKNKFIKDMEKRIHQD